MNTIDYHCFLPMQWNVETFQSDPDYSHLGLNSDVFQKLDIEILNFHKEYPSGVILFWFYSTIWKFLQKNKIELQCMDDFDTFALICSERYLKWSI